MKIRYLAVVATALVLAACNSSAQNSAQTQSGTTTDEVASAECENADTTVDLDICAAATVEQAREQLKAYTDTAIAHLRETSPETADKMIAQIRSSEPQWEAYVEGACGAVYTYWEEGTIRSLMASNCELELVRERTHHIWREYLVSMEGYSKLPEPKRGTFDYKLDEDSAA